MNEFTEVRCMWHIFPMRCDAMRCAAMRPHRTEENCKNCVVSETSKLYSNTAIAVVYTGTAVHEDLQHIYRRQIIFTYIHIYIMCPLLLLLYEYTAVLLLLLESVSPTLQQCKI